MKNILSNKKKIMISFRAQTSATIVSLLILALSANATSMDVNDPYVPGSMTTLSLEKAVSLAQINDPWLRGNTLKQKAIELKGSSVNTLPNPKISLGIANLPTNGFNFGQEAMTQVKVGISQHFPRGNTLIIKSNQLKAQSKAFPYQRQDRKSKVAVTVGTLWLDAYQIQQSTALIVKSRSLFEQLADVAEASYSAALGKTRQQDIVRAQLELTRLDDRLDKLTQKSSNYEGALLQWLVKLPNDENPKISSSIKHEFIFKNYFFGNALPEIELLNNNLEVSAHLLKARGLINYFLSHPMIVAVDKQINATKIGINLAKQKQQPAWGVNGSYGHRSDAPVGTSRANLFSVGLTMDLPLFNNNSQQQEVQSAIAQTEAVKTEKLLLLRQMLGAYSSAKRRLLRLADRQKLYQIKLLPQTIDQAEASLNAYTHNNGDFSAVVRSRIALLNTEIDQLTLNVEEQKIRLELNYLFVNELNTHVIKIDNKTKNSESITNASAGVKS